MDFCTILGERFNFKQSAEHLLRRKGVCCRTELAKTWSHRTKAAHCWSKSTLIDCKQFATHYLICSLSVSLSLHLIVLVNEPCASATGKSRIFNDLRRNGAIDSRGSTMQGIATWSDEISFIAGTKKSNDNTTNAWTSTRWYEVVYVCCG